MNLRRGLFRLWIVGAALFVLAVAGIAPLDVEIGEAALLALSR
jgi:hypothetical protein